MKLLTARSTPDKDGFTLGEVMIACAVFVIVIGALLGSQIYGMRLFQVVNIKLSASDDARLSLSQMLQDVRSGATVQVGNGDLTSFTEVPSGTNQSGNALQITMGLNTNNWVRYFYQASSNTLCRTEDGVAWALITANSITNGTPIFTSEDALGNTNTTHQGSAVIEVNLSFTKINQPLVPIGPGNYYDFYHYEARITPRAKP